MAPDALDKIKKEIKSIGLGRDSGRKDKIALCLAGGGITGAMYEIGCLAALDDFLEETCCTQVDVFVGSSAGALIASLLANGYSATSIFDGISQNSRSILNFKRKNIYDLKWSEFFKSISPLFKRLPRLIQYGWQNRKQATFMDFLSILQEFIPPGIFSLNNLDKFVRSVLYPEGKTNDFRNLSKELYIPATELDTGERWIFGEPETNHIPISMAVAASAAIPVFFRPYRIEGHDFIDGSTSRVAHLDIALKHGAKLIIIINPTAPLMNDREKICIPTFDGHCGRIREKGMGLVNDQARRIESKSRFDLGFKDFKLEHPDVDYIVIQPETSDATMFLYGVMEYNSRKSVLNHGYNMTLQRLEQEEEAYREIFERHNWKCREKLPTKRPETVDNNPELF